MAAPGQKQTDASRPLNSSTGRGEGARYHAPPTHGGAAGMRRRRRGVLSPSEVNGGAAGGEVQQQQQHVWREGLPQRAWPHGGAGQGWLSSPVYASSSSLSVDDTPVKLWVWEEKRRETLSSCRNHGASSPSKLLLLLLLLLPRRRPHTNPRYLPVLRVLHATIRALTFMPKPAAAANPSHRHRRCRATRRPVCCLDAIAAHARSRRD